MRIFDRIKVFWSKIHRRIMSDSVLSVAGIEKVSPSFLSKLVRESKKEGLNPDYLLGVMGFETGLSFSPSVRNPISGFIGLIQFGPEAATALGTTLEELGAMTAERQLDFVFEYYRRVLGDRKINTLSDHYMTVFSPRAIGKAPDEAVYFASSTDPVENRRYEQNKGLDRDNDGVITVSEASSRVQEIIEAAQGKPRTPVITSSGLKGIGVATVVVSGVLLAWGFSQVSSGFRRARP